MTKSVQVGEIELAYETFGDPAHPPVVLVMGLGTQMIAWPDAFCEDLAQDHYVIRYDNRDIGESTHLYGVKAPALAALAAKRQKPPYTVSDMGRDLLGLLDGLEIDRAHLVGVSMGGFISQSAAIQAPDRVRSLTLVMTSTGSRLVGRVDLRLIPKLLTKRSVTDREAAGDAAVETFRTIGSPGFDFDEEWYREIGRRSFDRGHDPGGYRRQLAACLVQSDRTARLRTLDVPAVVIHGLADPLVAPTGGLALARALKGSRFIGIPGMGHDLPKALLPEIAGHVRGVTARG